MRTKTLAHRLQMLVALVALFPLIIVAAPALFHLLPQTQEDISRHHEEMALSVAFQIVDHLQGAERELLSLADMLRRQAGTPTRLLDGILDSHVGGGEFFTAMYLSSHADMVIGVGLPVGQRDRRPDLLGIDLSRRWFIQKVRSTGKSVWSDSFLSTVSGKLAVDYAVPMNEQILVGEISAGRLTKYVSGIPAQSRQAIVVLDGQGQAIAYTQEAFAGHHLDLVQSDTDTFWAELFSGRDVKVFELSGRRYIFTEVPIKRLGWNIVVAQLLEEALKPLVSTLWVLGIGMLTALATSILAGWLLARKPARDFSLLADQARAIAQGDYSRAWPDSSIREFRDLKGDLQKMSSAIRQREEDLAESEARLLKAQSVGHVGSWELNPADGAIWSSAEAFRIYGLPQNETRTMSMEEVMSIPLPEEREPFKKALDDLLSNGKPLDLEYAIRRVSDNEVRYVHTKAEPTFSADDRPEKAIGTVQDVTERKELEQQLLHSQKMEAVGMLAGGVAHDFNNMLAVILGYTELMRLRMPPDAPYYEKLTEIEKAAVRSRDITRQLLAFSRKQIIAPSPQNLTAIVKDTLKTLTRLIGEDVRLTFKPVEDTWLVKVDPSQVDQILVNLAVNARDAMTAGGDLMIELSNVILDEGFCRHHSEAKPGHYVMLAMSDTGHGMDRVTMRRIFEPFFTTKEVGKGTGLGLATVYGIVKQNGGFLTVYSEVGQGTTFRIYLPRFQGQKQAEATAGTLIPEPGAGDILLVEDEDLMRQVVASQLEVLGYTVTSFKRPEEAVKLCQESGCRFDLLITDVIMPGMNGKELRDAIRAVYPDMGVLFMSGCTSDVIVQRGVLEQGVHFLAKPFNLGDLAHKVRQAMI